jgi:hypothetical protein
LCVVCCVLCVCYVCVVCVVCVLCVLCVLCAWELPGGGVYYYGGLTNPELTSDGGNDPCEYMLCSPHIKNTDEPSVFVIWVCVCCMCCVVCVCECL